MILNTANLLGPCLLLVALFLLAIVAFGKHDPEAEQFLTNTAAALIACALIIRLFWGFAIAFIRKQLKSAA